MPSVGNEGSITNVSLSERRGQTDAKPRAISSLLEYCRGAKEEDEVNLFVLCRAQETKVALPTIQCPHLKAFPMSHQENAQESSSFMLFLAQNHMKLHGIEVKNDEKIR